MNFKFVFSFIVATLILIMSWHAMVILGHGTTMKWFMYIWMPVAGFFWSFDLWLIPFIVLDFWNDKQIKNGIFAGSALSLFIAFGYIVFVRMMR